MTTKNQNAVQYFLLDAQIKRLTKERDALKPRLLKDFAPRKAAYAVAAMIDGARRVVAFTVTQRMNVDMTAAAAAYPIDEHPNLWETPAPVFVGTKKIQDDYRTVIGSLAVTGSEAAK